MCCFVEMGELLIDWSVFRYSSITVQKPPADAHHMLPDNSLARSGWLREWVGDDAIRPHLETCRLGVQEAGAGQKGPSPSMDNLWTKRGGFVRGSKRSVWSTPPCVCYNFVTWSIAACRGDLQRSSLLRGWSTRKYDGDLEEENVMLYLNMLIYIGESKAIVKEIQDPDKVAIKYSFS
jgi:hypothetical protein